MEPDLKACWRKTGALGEHLANEVLENLFADIAPEFWALEIVPEIFHGATDFGKTPAFLQITNNSGGAVETPMELLVTALEGGAEILIAGVKGGLERLKPL